MGGISCRSQARIKEEGYGWNMFPVPSQNKGEELWPGGTFCRCQARMKEGYGWNILPVSQNKGGLWMEHLAGSKPE